MTGKVMSATVDCMNTDCIDLLSHAGVNSDAISWQGVGLLLYKLAAW